MKPYKKDFLVKDDGNKHYRIEWIHYYSFLGYKYVKRGWITEGANGPAFETSDRNEAFENRNSLHREFNPETIAWKRS